MRKKATTAGRVRASKSENSPTSKPRSPSELASVYDMTVEADRVLNSCTDQLTVSHAEDKEQGICEDLAGSHTEFGRQDDLDRVLPV